MDAPRLAVRDIALFERRVEFRTPFRFGAVTVEGASQAFVRVEVELEDGRRAMGGTAELMVPKWFDKRPHLSVEDTVDELRAALDSARELYLAAGRDTAFGLSAACYSAHMARCADAGLPALAAAFGPAEMDKAILDALLRALGLNVFEGFSANVMGLDARLAPDISDAAVSAFLSSRRPAGRVALRHTVGMMDPLDGPEGIAALGEREKVGFFKLKLSGTLDADRQRLAAIAARLPADSRVTLDANEQYADAAALTALADLIARDPDLAPIRDRLLYLEQPLPREKTFDEPLAAIPFDVIIDEADDGYGAFAAARALGYAGVSSKSCKGLYKSLVNGARAQANGGFLTAEDLTCQAGLAVQQDTALVAFLGLTHAERNGHHYADGFSGAPEADAFLAAHPEFYERSDGDVRLDVKDGAFHIATLAVPGFASAVLPDWGRLAPLKTREPAFAGEDR
ncbi:enolase C-terminal domain-like protein [Aquabacter sp. CN5-332]|uniref:enolase C-terminal domain-like protein n=1 Tax=Aquabacter sp. CN5-332 TaxID=3156608 RepID=UPI0032B5D8D5